MSDHLFSDQLSIPPIQTIEAPAFTSRSLKIKVLRMDKLHPVVSGNKWMKLQPWLGQALQAANEGIVTKGGPWSNHVHAAAYAAHCMGLSFTAIIKAKKNMRTPMLEDAIKWGATILYTEDDIYSNEEKWTNLAIEKHSLYIPMGGEGPAAVKGVTDYINCLRLPAVDYVICPVGTGTTFAGIAHSAINFHSAIGINPGINDPNYDILVKSLEESYPGKKFSIIRDRQLKKFGKWPVWLINKMNEWHKEWQLPTDIIYTAKMVFIFNELVDHNYFEPGSSCLLVHTGGLQGNRSLPRGILSY